MTAGLSVPMPSFARKTAYRHSHIDAIGGDVEDVTWRSHIDAIDSDIEDVAWRSHIDAIDGDVEDVAWRSHIDDIDGDAEDVARTTYVTSSLSLSIASINNKDMSEKV